MIKKSLFCIIITAIITCILILPVNVSFGDSGIRAGAANVSNYSQFYNAIGSAIRANKPNFSLKISGYDKKVYKVLEAINKIESENKTLKFIVTGYSEKTAIKGKTAQVDVSFTYCDSAYIVNNYAEYYNIILSSIADVKDKVKIKINNYDAAAFNINKAIAGINQQDEDVSYFTGCKSETVKALDNKAAIETISFSYSDKANKILADRKQLQSKADQIIAAVIKPGMSEYQKELALHDYIIKNASYDEENYIKDTIPQADHSAYGVLIGGKGVCDGYAKAMKLLCDKAGLQSIVISGSAAGTLNGAGSAAYESHAWNLVQIDGKYYHVDVTWDDSPYKNSKIELTYNYFNLTDEDISGNHAWDKNKYPKCSSLEYNYFYRNKLYAADYNTVKELIENAAKAKTANLTMKIADYKTSQYNISRIIQAVLNKYSIDTANWYIDDGLGIVDIVFKY